MIESIAYQPEVITKELAISRLDDSCHTSLSLEGHGSRS